MAQFIGYLRQRKQYCYYEHLDSTVQIHCADSLQIYLPM